MIALDVALWSVWWTRALQGPWALLHSHCHLWFPPVSSLMAVDAQYFYQTLTRIHPTTQCSSSSKLFPFLSRWKSLPCNLLTSSLDTSLSPPSKVMMMSLKWKVVTEQALPRFELSLKESESFVITNYTIEPCISESKFLVHHRLMKFTGEVLRIPKRAHLSTSGFLCLKMPLRPPWSGWWMVKREHKRQGPARRSVETYFDMLNAEKLVMLSL